MVSPGFFLLASGKLSSSVAVIVGKNGIGAIGAKEFRLARRVKGRELDLVADCGVAASFCTSVEALFSAFAVFAETIIPVARAKPWNVIEKTNNSAMHRLRAEEECLNIDGLSWWLNFLDCF